MPFAEVSRTSDGSFEIGKIAGKWLHRVSATDTKLISHHRNILQRTLFRAVFFGRTLGKTTEIASSAQIA
jgi:hypothetical protein